jgi:phage-related protein
MNILRKVYPATTRGDAKRFLYAYLFGGGGAKLGNILSGKSDAKLGKMASELFESSIPGLGQLKDTLSEQFKATKERLGDGWSFIRGLDGRLVFVESEHQTLNYRLQTTEGITCKAAIVMADKRIKEAGIKDFYWTIHYHDEMAVVCKDEHAEQVRAICVGSFEDAPKIFGITCMGGDGKIGKTYYEVH